MLSHSADFIFCLFLVIIKLSHPGKEFINLLPWLGLMTKRVVESASASIAVGALTETLALIIGDNPVLGFII